MNSTPHLHSSSLLIFQQKVKEAGAITELPPAKVKEAGAITELPPGKVLKVKRYKRSKEVVAITELLPGKVLKDWFSLVFYHVVAAKKITDGCKLLKGSARCSRGRMIILMKCRTENMARARTTYNV
uniref:Uncharacterized protein n=1 Tax=Salix viminalis TaxID=40686 RepID=A0A6N2MCC1_SALVM